MSTLVNEIIAKPTITRVELSVINGERILETNGLILIKKASYI